MDDARKSRSGFVQRRMLQRGIVREQKHDERSAQAGSRERQEAGCVAAGRILEQADGVGPGEAGEVADRVD